MIKDTNYLIDKFMKKRDRPWIIFTGSAISFNRPSNLASVDLIKSIALKFLSNIKSKNLDKLDKDKIINFKNQLLEGSYKEQFDYMPFETFISQMHRNIPSFSSDLIVDLFGLEFTKEFNINHEIIALLLKHKYIRQIITTNFDLLLEEALKSIGIGSSSFIIQDKKNRNMLNSIFFNNRLTKSLSRIPIIKLHGCCSIKDSVVFTEETIDKWRADVFKVLPYFLMDTNVIFIGYGGKDLLDIMPVVYELTNSKKMNLYWLFKEYNDLPKNLEAVFINHDLISKKGENSNMLIKLAEAVGIDKETKTPFFPFPGEKEIKSVISPLIKKNIKKGATQDLASLKTLSSIFGHLKIGEAAYKIAEISKKINETYFTFLDYGIFYEILRLYPLAISSFMSGLKTQNISDLDRISYYCSIGFCESVIGKLTTANDYYKKCEQIIIKNNIKLDVGLADKLYRGLIETILKSMETRIVLKNKRIMKVEYLFNKLEPFVKQDNNLYAFFIRDVARLKLLKARTLNDFLDAEKESLESLRISEARNQFEGMTVGIRTLVMTNPAKYYEKLIKLANLAKKKKYLQEYVKMLILIIQCKISKSRKFLRFSNKYIRMILSVFWFLKPYFTVLVWKIKTIKII